MGPRQDHRRRPRPAAGARLQRLTRTRRPGARLLLGPVLRYADTTRAAVWVETVAPARVEVLGRSTTTFEVEGHHYAHLVVDGLTPGTDTPYDVRLDGEVVWPAADDPRPAPRLRTRAPGAPLDLVFGSCRKDRPHAPPYELEPDQHPQGIGVDALQALALACQRGERPLPDLLLMLGDQVYADEGLSPALRAQQRARRAPDSEPVGEVADFEEYTWLYADAWSDADVRWLLATVPSGMVLDDHDVRDDWNISHAWRERVRRLPWWRERMVGAFMSYWLYQHLGNLSPDDVERQGLLRALQGGDDGALRRWAEEADDEPPGGPSRWSWARDVDGTRLVVLDVRSTRVLAPDARSMLAPAEWAQVEPLLRGDCDHLLVATSLPLLVEGALHDVERWNEAVCHGAWGARAARLAERLRQATDLEHWSAFPASFARLTSRLVEVASGRLGRAPATVLILSGDVHHSYVAPLRLAGAPLESALVQVVCSPMRNAFPRALQRLFAFARGRPVAALGRALARAARVPPEPLQWEFEAGPWYRNSLATLRLDGRRADVGLHQAVRRDGTPRLEPLHAQRLDRGAVTLTARPPHDP